MNNVEEQENNLNTYKILIENRDYTKWSIHDPITFIEIKENYICNPEKQKLFNKDIFNKDTGKIVHSSIRETKCIAGILVLEGNKTYGRSVNKKKLLYKCIPDDKRLPIFLIPYELKLGFSKKILNKYVLFRFDNWTEKHPYGILTQTLGDLNNLEAFYEYQLYRKSLQENNGTLMEEVKRAISVGLNIIEDSIYNNSQFIIEDRTESHNVFTVDYENTVDFDDGISITSHSETEVTISIYISNVYLIIETLGLWDSLTRRVSTIYLPDRRRPMLPSLLSDSLCSLQEGKRRFCFVCDVNVRRIDEITNEWKIENISYKNALIKIFKNYKYGNVKNDKNYIKIKDITNSLDKNVRNSHDVIAYWMIQTNVFCAEKMFSYGNGIFRSVVLNTEANSRGVGLNFYSNIFVDDIPVSLEPNTRNVIRSWILTTGQYNLCSESGNHVGVYNKKYIHITSPIRRLVDLLNQMILSKNMGLIKSTSNKADEFLKRWLNDLDYINTSMRAIRKIQTDCFLLQKCTEDETVLENEYNGVLFDRLVKSDGSVTTYMVYLPELKLFSRYTLLTTNAIYENYQTAKFKIYLFEDKDNLKKKIKIGMTAQSSQPNLV